MSIKKSDTFHAVHCILSGIRPPPSSDYFSQHKRHEKSLIDLQHLQQ